jgi:hypothetical protein
MLREYRRGPGDPVLSALVLCGLAGPISVHTPDVCYRGAGYELAAPPARHRIERGEGQEPAWFWVGDFEQRGVPAPRRLRIFWGWNAGGGWKAADSARFEFAGAPVLLKLYVIREMSHGGEPLEKDPARGLLRELLAALDTLITD